MHFKAWWPDKMHLKRKTSKAARKLGFGMNAQEQDNYQEGINNFTSAHAATITTVMGLQQQNAQLNQILPTRTQHKIAMYTQLVNMHISNAITNVPPTQAYQHYGWGGRVQGGRGSGQGGHDWGGGYNQEAAWLGTQGW